MTSLVTYVICNKSLAINENVDICHFSHRLTDSKVEISRWKRLIGPLKKQYNDVYEWPLTCLTDRLKVKDVGSSY